MKKSDYSKSDCMECETETKSTAKTIKNPDHSNSQKRINRAKGQLDAVARMIEERRYCPDIINQIRAATHAIKALEQEILRGHLQSCVKGAFQSKNPSDMAEKIEEILKLTNGK